MVTSLETGDYTVEVVSKGQTVKKQMHVYEDGNAKIILLLSKLRNRI